MVNSKVSQNIANKFYIRFFALLLLLVMIPLIILSTISYASARHEKKKNAEITNRIYLEHTANYIDLIFAQISQGYEYITNEGDFQRFENSYSGYLYETGQNDGYVTPALYREYQAFVENVKVQLDFFKKANSFISSIYFFDRKKEVVLTDRGTKYKTNEFYDTEWISEITIEHPKRTVLPRRTVIDNNGEKTDVITILYPSHNEKTNTLVVNIDCSTLFTSVIDRMQNKNYTDLIVLTADGTPVWETNSDLSDSIAKEIVSGEKTTTVSAMSKKIDGEKYYTDCRITLNFKRDLGL